MIKAAAFLGAFFYLGAFICAERNKKKPETVFWAMGVFVGAFLVGRNWLVNGYVPFVSMYQVLTFLSLTFFPIYLLVKHLNKSNYSARYFQLTAGIVLTGVGFMDATDKWAFPPSLQSVWFVPHVLAYMIGYTLIGTACLITLVGFVKKSEREVTGRECNALARIAFPFMTAGMLLGALWANQVWGNYWSWDIKENWALITWLTLSVYLHFYKDKKLKKFTPILIVLTLVGVLMTMVFINLFDSTGSMHTYS